MPFAATWINPEIIILSEIYEKKNTNEHIYKEKQIHRHRKLNYGYQRGKV